MLELARDKLLFYRWLLNEGLPCLPCYTTPLDPNAAFPLIGKPRRGWGGRGLHILADREAFLKMKESKPGVRAIVASGYLEPAIRSEMLKAGVIDTIQKPYDFNDLLAKIRSIIGPQPVTDDHPELF